MNRNAKSIKLGQLMMSDTIQNYQNARFVTRRACTNAIKAAKIAGFTPFQPSALAVTSTATDPSTFAPPSKLLEGAPSGILDAPVEFLEADGQGAESLVASTTALLELAGRAIWGTLLGIVVLGDAFRESSFWTTLLGNRHFGGR